MYYNLEVSVEVKLLSRGKSSSMRTNSPIAAPGLCECRGGGSFPRFFTHRNPRADKSMQMWGIFKPLMYRSNYPRLGVPKRRRETSGSPSHFFTIETFIANNQITRTFVRYNSVGGKKRRLAEEIRTNVAEDLYLKCKGVSATIGQS